MTNPNLAALLRRNVGGSGDYKTEVRASLLDEAADEIERLRAALSASRGQWIHSVNARQCLEALGEAQDEPKAAPLTNEQYTAAVEAVAANPSKPFAFAGTAEEVKPFGTVVATDNFDPNVKIGSGWTEHPGPFSIIEPRGTPVRIEQAGEETVVWVGDEKYVRAVEKS